MKTLNPKLRKKREGCKTPPAFIVGYGEYTKQTRLPLSETRLFKFVSRNGKTRKSILSTFEDLMDRKKYRTLYNQEMEKVINAYVARAIEHQKTNRLFAFDLIDLFLGVPNGFKYVDPQLHFTLAKLGAINRGCSILPIWSDEPHFELIRNVLHPLWSMTPYSPTTLLNYTYPPYMLDSRFWIVKTNDRDQLEECKKYKVRSCPHFNLIVGEATKVSEVRESVDYKTWERQSWNGCHSLWYMNENDPIKASAKLVRLARTLRFIEG